MDGEVARHAVGGFSLLLAVSIGRLIVIRPHGPRILVSTQATPAQIQGIETTHARLVGLPGLAWGLVP